MKVQNQSNQKRIHCAKYAIGVLSVLLVLLCNTALSLNPPLNKDSLFRIINNPSTHDTVKARTIGKLSIEYMMDRVFDKAEQYAFKALNLSEKIGYKRGIAYANGITGAIYAQTYNNKKALQYCNKAISQYNEINDTVNLNYQATLEMISNVYLQTGLYDKALNYEFRLSKTLESIRDTLSNYAGAFNNIANIYRTKRDYKRAIYYYEISYKEYKDDTLSATCVYYGLGECYAVSDYNKSLGYLIRLENIAKIKNDTIGLSMAYSGMGTLFKINGEYKKAIVNFRKGLIFRENESFSDMYLNIGEIYFKLKNYDSSEYYFNKSLALAKIIESKKFIMLNYKNLYRLDSLKGDFKDAFLYQGLYQQYKDSIFNSEAEQKIVATEMNLTFEKEKFVMKAKQDEITKMAELNRKRQREIIFVVCVLLFLVVAVTITVYNGYVKQGKAYKLITHQKRLVDDKQKEILASIRYATRIQGSLLPTEKYVEKTLNRLNKI